MASFTDKISQFNPYIQELPVEEMVKVGMAKQGQYDQGVQKIQGYINNIAGMDVYNEGDKALIQSKLNELGSRLKTVAAGDFSNSQLVNSVGGMATQLVKDPLVQNAVMNTTAFRKTLARIEKDKEAGKSGKNNIDDFYRQAQPWMESNAPGTKLNANYSQYRNVNKTAMEAIKALHPDLKSIDIPFEVKNGKIDTGKIADAMKRNKIEGVTEGKIETALRAALTPEDYNQLDIDGRSTFANVPPEKLNTLVSTQLDITKKQNGAEIERLKTLLPTQVQDPNKTAEINDRIAYYKNQGYIVGNEDVKGTLDDNAKDNYELIAKDPNQVKQSLYRQGFFQQWGNAFKWSTEDYRYEDNPFKKVEQFNQKLALDWAAENRQKTQGERRLDLEERKVKVDEAGLKLKMEEAYGTPGIPVEEGNQTDNILKSVERLDGHMKGIGDGIMAKRKELQNRGYTDAQIDQMVGDYQKNGNSANIPATAIGTIQDILKDNKYLADLQKLKDNAKAEADAEVESSDGVKAQIAEKEKFIKNNFSPDTYVTMNFGDGKTKIMNARALMSDINNGKIGYQVDKAPLGQVYVTIDGVTTSFPKIGVGSNPQLKAIIDKAVEYDNKFGKFDKDLEKKKDEKFKEKLSPRVAELVPTITAIGFGKEHTIPTNIANNLSAFVKAANSKEIAADSNFDSDTAGSMLVGDNLKNTKVFLRQTADGYQAVISDMTGSKKDQVINLDQSKAIQLFGAQYVDTQKQEALKLRAGRGSNNINGGAENAPMQVQYGDFPNIQHYQVTAQLDEDSKYKGEFVPTVHLKKNDGSYQSFEISGKNRSQRLGYDQGKQQLSNLTDDTMMKLLKELYPKYDFSQIYRK